MKLIESKAELILQEPGVEGIYKAIELAGRTAYHSSPKYRYWTSDRKYFINEGTEDFKLLYNPEEYPIKQNISAKDFVDRMIKSKHGAALEAGTVYLKVPVDTWREDEHEWVYMFPEELPWVSLDCDGKHWYITTNFRHILEGNVGIKTMNEYLCLPSKFHEKRYTIRFITDIGVCRELLRHRMFSFLNESTRYCNYNREKFGKEVTFITPSWYHYDPNEAWEDVKNAYFREICEQTEAAYLNSIKNGATPQEARQVLPLATKTELIMTGFSSDWRFLMDLRLFGKTGAPHPDMLSLMQKTQKTMQEAGIWEDIMSKPSKFE